MQNILFRLYFVQNWPRQQSHGLFANAEILVPSCCCITFKRLIMNSVNSNNGKVNMNFKYFLTLLYHYLYFCTAPMFLFCSNRRIINVSMMMMMMMMMCNLYLRIKVYRNNVLVPRFLAPFCLSACVSVCLSVSSSHAWLKHFKISKHVLHYTIEGCL